MFRKVNEALALLRAINTRIYIMALDFTKLQSAVAQLSTDVKAALALIPPASNPSDQATVDAVTTSLSALDDAVKAAEPAPAPAPQPAPPADQST